MDTFDLGSVVVRDVAPLTITHPTTGQPTTWVLEIAGPGHPATIALNNDLARERLAEARDQTMARVNGRKWKAPETDPEADKREGAKRWSRRIVGWSPVTLNGAPFPYTPENAAALLTEPGYGWVATQFWDLMAADAGFIETSAKG
jgi:hypothetical protein